MIIIIIIIIIINWTSILWKSIKNKLNYEKVPGVFQLPNAPVCGRSTTPEPTPFDLEELQCSKNYLIKMILVGNEYDNNFCFFLKKKKLILKKE